jgi:hypothetical protein
MVSLFARRAYGFDQILGYVVRYRIIRRRQYCTADFHGTSVGCQVLTAFSEDAHMPLEQRALSKVQAFHSKGAGAAPLIFRDNISVPTIPALARARRHLNFSDASDVTLIITGGLRHPALTLTRNNPPLLTKRDPPATR